MVRKGSGEVQSVNSMMRFNQLISMMRFYQLISMMKSSGLKVKGFVDLGKEINAKSRHRKEGMGLELSVC